MGRKLVLFCNCTVEGYFRSSTWWADKGNGFAFVPAVNAEIFVIHGDDAVARVKLAHADEQRSAKSGSIAARKGYQLRQVVLAVESKSDQFVSNHRENEGDAPQMKGGLCQNRT